MYCTGVCGYRRVPNVRAMRFGSAEAVVAGAAIAGAEDWSATCAGRSRQAPFKATLWPDRRSRAPPTAFLPRNFTLGTNAAGPGAAGTRPSHAITAVKK
jgi:hypothetical protein